MGFKDKIFLILWGFTEKSESLCGAHEKKKTIYKELGQFWKDRFKKGLGEKKTLDRVKEKCLFHNMVRNDENSGIIHSM